ncbi:unnamed protein product [Polarella glacialis]|uniref:Major facilitator superfamily (MFS) profile domain-containing protein n=1 Tax=Polarella glacialis TaxID=89957 RepID=A0A813GFM6_POLGL|nr:unnamed protein product [Polarella glacialis]
MVRVWSLRLPGAAAASELLPRVLKWDLDKLCSHLPHAAPRGVAFGYMADRIGRRPAVLLSMVGMMVATVGQGLLLSYLCCGETAGSFGLVMLIILRACQGLSAGGEIGSIVTYLSETAPEGYLLVACSAIFVTGATAFILSSLTVAFLVTVLGPEAMLDWGWRVPFLIVLVPGLISLWGCRGLPETEIFLEEQRMRSERCEHQEKPQSWTHWGTKVQQGRPFSSKTTAVSSCALLSLDLLHVLLML